MQAKNSALNEVPLAWYEKGRLRAALPAWLGGLAAGYALKHSGLDVGPYIESVTGAAGVMGAALYDRKTSRNLLDSIEKTLPEGIDFGYFETNELVGDVKTKEEFIRSTKSAKILGLEAIAVGIGCLGWQFAAPVAAIRSVYAVNNSRKSKRIDLAVAYAKQDKEV